MSQGGALGVLNIQGTSPFGSNNETPGDEAKKIKPEYERRKPQCNKALIVQDARVTHGYGENTVY